MDVSTEFDVRSSKPALLLQNVTFPFTLHFQQDQHKSLHVFWPFPPYPV